MSAINSSNIYTAQDVTQNALESMYTTNAQLIWDTVSPYITIYVTSGAFGSEVSVYGQLPNIIFEDRRQSLPSTGEPNSIGTLFNPDGSIKQVRRYGPDGKAVRDRDFGHDGDGHGFGFPHDHPWEDGKRKTAEPVDETDDFKEPESESDSIGETATVVAGGIAT